VKQIIELMNNSTSKLFKARCDDNLDRIIRLKRNGNNSDWYYSSKRLFSSYLAGKLACELGIYSPSVTLAEVNIDKELYMSLNAEEEWFDQDCNIGVASEYIELTNLSKSFQEFNDFISFLKSDQIYCDQIYGMKVFLHWIYLEDYGKNENLQFDKEKKIYFIDFDMAFTNSSCKNIWSVLQEYNWIKIQTDPTKYFNGFTNEIEPFEMWFDKLLKLDLDKMISSLDELPKCWNIPMNYLNDMISFLFFNRDKFISEFRRAIEMKKGWNQRTN
jgi:hypothetical protein